MLPFGQSFSSSWSGWQWGIPSHFNSKGIGYPLHWNSVTIVVVVTGRWVRGIVVSVWDGGPETSDKSEVISNW